MNFVQASLKWQKLKVYACTLKHCQRDLSLYSSSELTECRYPGLLYQKNRSDTCPWWESTHRLPACKVNTLSTRPGSRLRPGSDSGIRVAVSDCSVNECHRWRLPYQTAKLCMCTQNIKNTTRMDARCRVCAAMVPYR